MVKVLLFSFAPCFTRLRCYLSNGRLKGESLDLNITKAFGVRKLKNTAAMRVIFFLKIFKTESKFRKWKKKYEIIFHF